MKRGFIGKNFPLLKGEKKPGKGIPLAAEQQNVYIDRIEVGFIQN